MPSGRSIVRWTGVALIVAGVIAALTPLFFGYAPWAAAAWWSLNFNVFVGGIAALIVGVAAVLYAQYYMKAAERPIEERKGMEIPV